MAEAKFTFQTVLIDAAPTGGDKATPLTFRATGKRIDFPGFLRAYVEGSDDPAEALDDQDSLLPKLPRATRWRCCPGRSRFRWKPSSTRRSRPPATRRPASLNDSKPRASADRAPTRASSPPCRTAVTAEKQGNQLVPTFTALAVNRLLERNFPHLVDYKFTAQMENQLDEIADGRGKRLPYLEKFYKGEDGLDRQVKSKEESIDPRDACTLRLDNVTPDVRVGRYGPYFEAEVDGEKFTASLPAERRPRGPQRRTRRKINRGEASRPAIAGRAPGGGAGDVRQKRAVRAVCPARRGDGRDSQTEAVEHPQVYRAGRDHRGAGGGVISAAASARPSHRGRPRGEGRRRPVRPVRAA